MRVALPEAGRKAVGRRFKAGKTTGEGDKRRAASVLGCSLKTLYNKLNSYARTGAPDHTRITATSLISTPYTGASASM